ncbi:MAG TPA: alpha/beta-hydrolase family protein [Candidatus Saccharimonadales bacterium]|nr:alpha/beta-hydrolase family protein [Candidatus Saccharimonadales bacterium]
MRHMLTGFAHWLRLDFSGVCGGLIFFWASCTPSLLPRGYVVQGIASGLSVATGYGLGVLASRLYHELPAKRRWVMPHDVKRVIIVVFLVTSVVFVFAGLHWQQAVRQATDAAAVSGDYPIRIVLIASILALLLIAAGRGTRRLGRYFGRKLRGRLPPTVALYGGGILAAVVLLFLINGVIIKGVFGFINYSFGLANKGTPDGIHQPQASIYSGSPDSKIDWNTLGEKGREFVASAPPKTAIEAFSGQGNGTQPSRLYAGLESADTLQARVNLLVAELNRTHAETRQAVVIAIPTGSGGINAKAVQSVEYIYNGNTTTLGIQYSYLPSWLSFLADQETARENGRVLTEAVYDWWSHLQPTANRPKLLMYGESLGTLGADGAFSGVADMHSRMSGVLLAGPPNANQLWSNIVADRDTGTPAVLPTYQHGEVARFTDGKTTLANNPPERPWADNRVAIIQHASDPVVWASTSLFIHKPDWLREPRGYDVLPNMNWYPFVTGWQVALDLPFAFSATPGHGHRYDNSVTNAWIAILQPNLSPSKATQLQHIIDTL